MPFELTWEPRGVYRRYFGDVTLAERRRSLDLICADPRFDQLRYSITDFLGVDTYETSPEATEVTAALHIAPLATNPNIVMAAVATDPRIIDVIEHFRALAFTSQPYRVFGTAEAARQWIADLASRPIQLARRTLL